MRGAIYCRVAGSIQGSALDMQKTMLERFAEERQDETVAVYLDSGHGRDLKRPGLQDLLHAASRNEFDTLLLMSLSRLSRNTSDLMDILKLLMDAGVCVVSVQEGDIITSGIRTVQSLLERLTQI